jgi:hypothetical protein
MMRKRIVDSRIAEERTVDKLTRDLDALPANSRDRARKQQEVADIKVLLAQRRV